MSRKTSGFSRQRSASLKERFFISRERKTSKSVRARLQSTPTESAKDRAGSDTLGSLPPTSKFNLVREANLRVHDLEKSVPRNLWEKLRENSRFPWNWVNYTVILGEKELYSPTPFGVFAKPIPYASIESVTVVNLPHLPFYYVKLSTSSSSFLIQTPDIYQRDRLLHSLQWKREVYKYEKILYSATRPDVILQGVQKLVTLTLEGPLYVDDTHNTLLDIVSNLLAQNEDILSTSSHESLMMTLAPLFKENQPSIEMCSFFTKHCRDRPRSHVVIDIFTSVVQRILKYNANFSKTVYLRKFVKEYIQALSLQNDGEAAVRRFVLDLHGPLSTCPHKRILNNLIAVCLSAIYDCFSPQAPGSPEKKNLWENLEDGGEKGKVNECVADRYWDKNRDLRLNNSNMKKETNIPLSKFTKNLTMNNQKSFERVLANMEATKEGQKNINLKESCAEKEGAMAQDIPADTYSPDIDTAVLFVQVLDEISKLSDWLPGLAMLLQPVPFQSEALQSKEFLRHIKQIMERILDDGRDEVVWCLLSTREQKDGWIQLFNPHSNLCPDDGTLFIKMTDVLLKCSKISSKSKKFVSVLLNTCLNAVLLLALRESETMVEVLCLILEYNLVTGKEEVQIVSTLRSTTVGKSRYERLCNQETVMKQKGGPDEYTLPPRSTDHDLHKFLNSGSYGNLKNLNLSFTYISCKSADLISRLPALQHLNLWSSHIQDVGLRRLCERLNLKSLNLCETKVTDEAIICLKDMTNLTDLNLNSTPVTDTVYQQLRKSLPNLVRCDVAYTEAWEPEMRWNSVQNNKTPVGADAKKLEYTQNI